MKYRNSLQKIILLVCLVAVLAVCVPSAVLAADKSFNKTATVTILEKNSYASTKKYTWIKYKAPGDGYLTITVKNKIAPQPMAEKESKDQDVSEEETKAGYASGILKLYDSKKKKALSGNFNYQTSSERSADYTVTYGVKKNTTYYLRVKLLGSASYKCKFHKISKSSCTSKSKAKEVAANKKMKGVITTGDKTAVWYKIKVSKKQILNLYYSGKTNDKLQFTFSGTYLKTTKRYVTPESSKEYHTYSLERVQPGTYYIKVEPENALSSGYYTIRWN